MPCTECDQNITLLPTGPQGNTGPTAGKPMLSSSLVTDINTPYIPVTSAGFSTIATLEWPGSTAIGATPTRIKVVYLVSAGTATIRIVDKDGNLIAQNTGTSATKTIMTINITASAGTLAGDSYWELQVQSSGSTTANIYAWTVY